MKNKEQITKRKPLKIIKLKKVDNGKWMQSLDFVDGVTSILINEHTDYLLETNYGEIFINEDIYNQVLSMVKVLKIPIIIEESRPWAKNIPSNKSFRYIDGKLTRI